MTKAKEPAPQFDAAAFDDYFSGSAEEWIEAGYGEDDPYVYPTARHRVRIVCTILDQRGRPLDIADIGCGGGNLAVEMARRGHTVSGHDKSDDMLSIARRAASDAGPEIAARTTFSQAAIEELTLADAGFDAVTAMGVIGYLAADDVLFSLAAKALRPGGLFLVSCRNRLFNMVSLSRRTIAEIKGGGALELLAEIEDLYRSIPPGDARGLLTGLRDVSAALVDSLPDDPPPARTEESGIVDGDMPFEPRQHTPRELLKTAERHGLAHKSYFGVHPHPMDPRLNRLLPPGTFNRLAGCAEALEHLPIALVWSSVFIAVFEKPEDR